MITQRVVSAGSVQVGNHLPFVLISGPCQMESRDHALFTAEKLKRMCGEIGIPLIYKSSFDKANRTSLKGKRGMGLDACLPIFQEIRRDLDLPVLTDVHAEAQCSVVAEAVDVLQIPAFLCRQTDLLLAAARTGKVINVKKGQFLAPWDMTNVAEKIASGGNDSILLTDRGTCFGYNTLISDMRGLQIMAEQTGYPVVFDATHSVQQPGGLGGASGGQRQFVATLSRAAVAVGVAAVFMESHENPDSAPSDGPCMMQLDALPHLLSTLKQFDRICKEN
jgi:2-dehydro-3-deoxyphosphooctonate aldolase (KDO 8-P synthase)